MINNQFCFTVRITIEVDGKRPDDATINLAIADAIYESFPGVVLDSEELDCNLFTNSIEVECYEMVAGGDADAH